MLPFSLMPFQFMILALLNVAFVLIVTTFATEPTGDSTPEVILMIHCFSIYSVLLSFHWQHAPTAMIAVRSMTRSPLFTDWFTV